MNKEIPNIKDHSQLFIQQRIKLENDLQQEQMKCNQIRQSFLFQIEKYKEKHFKELKAKKQWNNQIRILLKKYEQMFKGMELTDSFLSKKKEQLYSLKMERQRLKILLKKQKTIPFQSLEDMKRKELQLDKRIKERKERLLLLSTDVKTITTELQSYQTKLESLHKPPQQGEQKKRVGRKKK